VNQFVQDCATWSGKIVQSKLHDLLTPTVSTFLVLEKPKAYRACQHMAVITFTSCHRRRWRMLLPMYSYYHNVTAWVTLGYF